MPAPSFMQRFGPGLVANGYPILPIAPATKKPGRCRNGVWADYPDWTRHATRPTTEHELEAWGGWPDAGVGVVCGSVAAVDIDLDEPELDRGALSGSARRHPGAAHRPRVARAGTSAATRPDKPAFNLRVPEGVRGDTVEYMVSTGRRPQPLLSLGASLCALDALMGRRYRTESNLRSNLYIVGIADSGSGKNHSREIARTRVAVSGLVDQIGSIAFSTRPVSARDTVSAARGPSAAPSRRA